MQRGYALCTAARSGSNWICQLLAATNVLGKPLEYFNGVGLRLFTDPAYPDDASQQIRRVLTTGATQNGVYGVKVFPWQLDPIARHVRWAYELPNLRYVHLERRDLLGQAISLLRANQTRQWRSAYALRGEAAYDADGILRYLHEVVRDQARWSAYFARNGIEPVRLVYEDAVLEPQAVVTAVAELVGVEPPGVDPGAVDVTVQRDATTEIWRARFIDEHADATYVDVI